MSALSRAAAVVLAAAAPLAAEEGPWTLTAARVDAPPTIDGVWEDVWYRGTAAKGFREFRPDFGKPAEADTEVYVLYDDRALYVGWICHEPDTRHLVAAATVHDMFLNNDDCVDVMIDTANDRNTCYDLMVNYRGVKYEGMGFSNGVEWSAGWDGYWEVKTSVGEGAWYAEMAIPWASIRYDRRAPSFGVQFTRYRINHFESTFWSGNDNDITRVSDFGRLGGLANLPPPKPFKFTPYATARAEDRRATPAFGYEPSDGWEFDPRAGFDFQYRAGASTQALLTVLPDYAYIEADPAQINLTPGEIYLTEKRPFFTDNQELFADHFSLVYTRRLTEIAGGAKASGKAGPVGVGAFDALLKDDDPRYPGDNVWAGRVRAELPGRSGVGAIGVGRRQFDGLAAAPAYAGGDLPTYNNVAGADGRLGLPFGANAQAEVLASSTGGDGGDGYAYTASVGRPGATQYGYAYYSEISEDFRADTAFLQPEQLGIRAAGAEGQKEWQVNRGGVRFFKTFAYYEHNWNTAGDTVFNFVRPEGGVTLANNLSAGFRFEGGRDLRYVSFGYPAFGIERYQGTLSYGPSAWGGVELDYWQGEYYGEYYHDYAAEVTLIPTPRLVVKPDAEVAVPRTGDRSLAANLNATYNLTDDLYWRVLVRADSATRTGLASTLWGWDFRPGSTAYLAYEQRRDAVGHFLLADQLIFLKVSYMINV